MHRPRCIIRNVVLAVMACLACTAMCGCGGGGGGLHPTIIVNTLDDISAPPTGTVSLRSAIAAAGPNDVISFAPSLNGGTIALTIIGSDQSPLYGETYNGMTFAGYQLRNYGKSALYARKNLRIDASNLSNGITIAWTGGNTNHARVLGLIGDLTLNNVTVTGGYSNADTFADATQPYTLARGGGLAVWGQLTMNHCTVYGNHCEGDTNATRDRGAFGGGIYADGLNLADCVIAGNSVVGYGAAGGGIYSVGGGARVDGNGNDTTITRCAINGNSVTGQHAYGGGVFTLSGGPNNLATMTMTSCTVARNLAQDNPALPQVGQYYYRGGGIYMGGGSLLMNSCTVVENEVNGTSTPMSGKPNMGGGGIAATIGNAHTVEYVGVQHSIVVGNKMNGVNQDWYAGSILDFASYGYNLIGAIDFSQILVPVPDWQNLSRKHYPKVGDTDGITIAQAVDVAGATRSHTITSAGTDAGQPVVLWYPPTSLALSKVPANQYNVPVVLAGYTGFGATTDDFLNYVAPHVRAKYGSTVGASFGSSFGDMTGVTFYGPRVTWPSVATNAPWIAFWRGVDTELAGRLGSAGLNDEFWSTFTSGPLDAHVTITVDTIMRKSGRNPTDQRGGARPSSGLSSIGAIQ